MDRWRDRADPGGPCERKHDDRSRAPVSENARVSAHARLAVIAPIHRVLRTSKSRRWRALTRQEAAHELLVQRATLRRAGAGELHIRPFLRVFQLHGRCCNTLWSIDLFGFRGEKSRSKRVHDGREA